MLRIRLGPKKRWKKNLEVGKTILLSMGIDHVENASSVNFTWSISHSHSVTMKWESLESPS